MIREYLIAYQIGINSCFSVECCSECDAYDDFKCRFRDPALPAIDKLAMLQSKHNPNPIWNLILKHCNQHFRYGRFDCCDGCKFCIDPKIKECLFDTIWDMKWILPRKESI